MPIPLPSPPDPEGEQSIVQWVGSVFYDKGRSKQTPLGTDEKNELPKVLMIRAVYAPGFGVLLWLPAGEQWLGTKWPEIGDRWRGFPHSMMMEQPATDRGERAAQLDEDDI